MAPDLSVPAAIARLFEEAAEWRLLGLLFEYPTEAWRRRLEALSPDLPSESLRGLAAAALAQASSGLHVALFGPGGAVRAREVSYRSGVQPGYLMAELAAYYEAFGYQPALDEPGDHMAVTLGFVSYLKLKQAYALAAGATEHARIAEEAAADFLHDHLGAYAGPVAAALEDSGPAYLAQAARIIHSRAGDPPGGARMSGSHWPAEADSGEITCGSPAAGDGLIQFHP